MDRFEQYHEEVDADLEAGNITAKEAVELHREIEYERDYYQC